MKTEEIGTKLTQAYSINSQPIIEEENLERANQLALSGEFCQPRFSEKRNCYIFIRRKVE